MNLELLSGLSLLVLAADAQVVESTHPAPTIAWGIFLLLVVGSALFLLVMLVMSRLTSRPIPDGAAHQPGHRHSRSRPAYGFGAGMLAGLLFLVLLVGFTTVTSYRDVATATATRVESETHQIAVVRPSSDIAAPAPPAAVPAGPVPVGEPTGTVVAAENVTGAVRVAVSEPVAGVATALPEWTQKREVTLRSGRIPAVQFVLNSGEWSTPQEAEVDAVRHAIVHLKSRLQKEHPELAGQLTEASFRSHSLRDIFIEQKTRQFGGFTEPMAVAWVRYEDSPEVREPLLDALKAETAKHRTNLLAAVLGLVVLGLGAVSLLLRGLASRPGHRLMPVVAGLLVMVGVLFCVKVLRSGPVPVSLVHAPVQEWRCS